MADYKIDLMEGEWGVGPGHGLSGRALESPEFKPLYPPLKKKKEGKKNDGGLVEWLNW
jgi:hypothetical protein